MAKILKMLSLLIAISLAISASNTAEAQGPMMAPSPASEERPPSPASEEVPMMAPSPASEEMMAPSPASEEGPPSPASAEVPMMAPSPASEDVPMMAPSPASEEGLISPGSAGAPLPGLDCTDSLLNLSSCLTYVEEGSNLTVPEIGCCPGLSGLVNSQPICLCQLLASGDTFGVKIDTTKALMLPTACKVQTPPVSLCTAIGIPVASPMGPSGSPTSGGPEEPGSNASMISGTPAAAPTASTGSRTARATTSLAGLISLIITTAIF